MRPQFLFLFLFFCPLLSAQVVVLDSILSLSYTLVDTPIISKITYQYDDQLRETIQEEYKLDNFENLILNYRQTRTYNSDSETVSYASLMGADPVMTNSFRYTEYLNLEVGEPKWQSEDWDKDASEWKNAWRSIVTFVQNDDHIEYAYFWDGNAMEYVLEEKYETIKVGNTTTLIRSGLDGAGNFIPERKKIQAFRPDYEFPIINDLELYDEDNEEWLVEFKGRTTIDENTLTAKLEYWNDWSQFTDEFIKSDSVHIVLNEDLQHLEEHWYEQISWNYFEYQRFHEFRYRTDKLKAYEEIELLVEHPFQFYPSRRDYYYSEEAEVVSTQQVAKPFPAELIFANPMIDEDKIQVVGDGSAAFDFWLIDAQGKIIHQQSVKADDELSLAPLALSPGIYFMTLFGKQGGQKTWKMNYLK